MPELAGEYVDIPALLKGILNGYPGNSAIFREYLQNSDDAKASSQIFILDERVYAADSLVDPVLKACQGPALVAINDGVLEPADWTALQKIHSSSKTADESRTGKNGLGFRASYHLTENPHLLSGRKLLILDAHRQFKTHPGGVFIDTLDEGSIYAHQLTPFASYVDDPNQPFSGTIFRLPLRTEEQAHTSRIKDTATSVAEIQDLLYDFCTHEAEEVILFLKHITTIEVRHVGPDGEQVVVGRVQIDRLPEKQNDASSKTVYREIRVTDHEGRTTTRTWCHHLSSTSREDALVVMSTRLGYDMGDKLRIEKLSPGIELAFPIAGTRVSGRLYTLLPLPISTGFPMHVNAVFALTPDRQSLKNLLEVGGQKSREKLLVEWNKVIFELWVPRAWAELMADLVKAEHDETIMTHVADFWSFWPPQQFDEGLYWSQLPKQIVTEILRRRLAVFPSATRNNIISFVSLHDPSVLLAGPNPGIALDVFANLDIDVVQPPPYIFSLIVPLHRTFKAGIFSPRSLYERVGKRYPEVTVPPVEVHDILVITDFLASLTSQPPTLAYIKGVSWFSCTDNTRAAFGSHSKKYIVATSETECNLFSSHPRMLSWESMSHELRSQVSLPHNFGILNVSTLKPDDVALVLLTKFRHLKPPLPEIQEADHSWLVRFWAWMATWQRLPEFLTGSAKKCADLYILPTTERSLRKFSAHTFVFPKTESAAAVETWRLLEVRPLHEDLVDFPATKMKSLVEFPKANGYVPLLIRSCNIGHQTHLSQDALLTLQKSLFSGLPSSSKVVLGNAERSTLATMQIFKLRTQNGDAHSLGSIRGNALYVKVDGAFPIPVQPGTGDDTIFVDMTDQPTFAFVQLVYTPLPCVYKELDLVQMAFDHWDLQSTDAQDRLVRWLFDNIAQVPPELREQLGTLPFVTVESVEGRVRPDGLIDPTSSLRTLYLDEAGKMPKGLFAGKYLETMRALGFVHSRLDEVIVKERLDYLSRTYHSDPRRFEKAMYLVDVCNKAWEPMFEPLVAHMRARPWMPFDSGSPLLAPNQCRDTYGGRGTHEDSFYYDLALQILPAQIQITSPTFRAALGWSSVIRSEVLVNQFRLTIELEPTRDRNQRLIALINYLGMLHYKHKLSSAVVDDLVAASTGKAWIPISKYGEEATGTEFAVLSTEVDLKLPFHHIGYFQYPEFLEEMGCSQRPKLDVLVNVLNQVDFQSPKGVPASVAILQEIADQYPGFDPSSILVPGDNEEGLPLHRVYFRDMNFLNLSGGMIDLVSAHKSISRGLAEALGIPFLSALMLEDSAGGEDDAAEGEEQMSEDFVNRIQGFLREYDVRYAMNEFLANADDAHATEFSILLDTPNMVGERFLSPAFQRLAGTPLLVLHNNATFSEADFAGLRQVGMGGKRDRTNTHGRHGLGALSFYYFTDVVTVISGEDVLFLDPSGEHLPPLRHGKRTALRRKISQFTRQFPDQLKMYDSLFDFNANGTFYDGTLFLLPLKTSISETPCTSHDVHDMIKASYRSLSEKAFFFTHLEQINAKERTTSGDRSLWSLSATSAAEVPLENGLIRRDLKLEHRNGLANSVIENWLIVTSGGLSIPAEHESTAVGLKLLPGSMIRVQLAIRADNAHIRDFIPRSSLFSTLSLPKPTSLPFHVNARFAISSNRQSIVLVPSGSDTQMDPKTAYNVWILEELVPPLYLAAIHYLVHNDPTNSFYHDRWWLLNSVDDISRFVQRPFLAKLVESDKELFQDFSRHWVPFHDAVFSKSEPEQITRLLRTAKAPKFVVHEHLTGLAQQKCAKTVDGQFMRNILASAEGRQAVFDMYTTKKIDRSDIARILDYIRREEGLEGLPLIVLSSGALVGIPGKEDGPVYQSAPSTVTGLFSLGSFMASIYTMEAEKRLIDDENLNVLDLTEGNILSLVKKELVSKDLAGKKAWLEKFWKSYSDLPGPPSLPSLEGCGYQIVLGSTRVLRLAECTRDQVIYHISRRTPIVRWVLDILKKFDLEIINPGGNPALDEYLSPRFPNAVTNVLLCMKSKGIINWAILEQEEQKQFAIWIRENLFDAIHHWRTTGCMVGMTYLRQLPIWPAQDHQGQLLHSMSGIRILPEVFDLQHILPYQKAGVIVSPHSVALLRFIEFVNNSSPKSMSPKAIMDVVEIPQYITPEGLQPIRSFITSMLELSHNELLHAEIKVPDQRGDLRDVRELYDDSVPLFAETLVFTARPSFIHPTFHDLQQDLRSLGLRHEVNPDSFRTCAQEISHAMQSLEDGTVDRDALLQMSDFAFNIYQTTIPRMIMINPAGWANIDAIAFVRRKEVRRQGASYDVGRYFEGELPPLLPPHYLVRQSMEAIAWTQRALFYQEPSDEVLAVNQTIGIPSVNEVVEHLKVLATKIAPDHPGNTILLHDLKATYAWLNDHSEEAHEALFLAGDVPLFLNVNDPAVDSWAGQWINAQGMVLHLHYDCGGLKKVGRLLSKYPKLLAVSGCVTLKSFERGPREEPTKDVGTSNDEIRGAFDAMRKSGELTDVVLVPSTSTITEDVEGREVDTERDPGLHAHLSFLAAAIPHVRQSAQGWLVNSTGKIPFYGSVFGAKAFLDFAYTGNFECSTPTTQLDDLANLMRDLLELLPIADEWDMPLLKRLLEHKIIHKYNMIQRLPHEYHTLLEQADKYKAESLTKALVDFKKENEEFLRVLHRDSP